MQGGGRGAIKIYGIITARYRSSNEEKRVKREKKEGGEKRTRRRKGDQTDELVITVTAGLTRALLITPCHEL